MPNAQLPEHPSLEFLKKLAKERLRLLRSSDRNAKLATALLSVARDHGFSSWRALKTHVEERQNARVAEFVEACRQGNREAVQTLLAAEPDSGARGTLTEVPVCMPLPHGVI